MDKNEAMNQDTPVTPTENAAAEAAKPSGKKTGKKVAMVLGIIAAVLVAGYVAVCGVAAGGSKVFSKTDVLGVDVSGMTRAQIEEMWAANGAEAISGREIPVLIDGEEATRVTLAQIGVTVTPEDAAQAAWDAGHSNSFLADGWAMLRSLVRETSVTPTLSVDSAVMAEGLKTVGEELDYAPVDGSYRIDESKSDGFYVTRSADGRQVDLNALQETLQRQLEAGSLAPARCVYGVLGGKPVDLEGLSDQLRDAVNAAYDKSTGGITPSKDGIVFDPAQARELVAAVEPGTEAEIPCEVTPAKISEAHLKEVLFRDRLGSYTTSVGGSAARKNNIALAAARINGTVLNSGETFSYNQVVGQRTAARGFQAAPAYVGGKTVDEIGGGICQVSSTLYYATLLSNLQIVQRWAHAYAPAYITFGCDATVSWGGPDYEFRNNTDYPIKVTTSYSGGRLTVTFYGTKLDNSYVQIISKTLSSKGYDVVYEKTNELPAGVEQVDQTPYTGYYVKTWRNIYAGDGTLLSSTEEAVSDYNARNKIIKVGTRVDPAPAALEEPAAPTEPTTPDNNAGTVDTGSQG